jgi:hypothetical protein
MKTITTEQINKLLTLLAELPAKNSFELIVMLQNLPDKEQIKVNDGEC